MPFNRRTPDGVASLLFSSRPHQRELGLTRKQIAWLLGVASTTEQMQSGKASGRLLDEQGNPIGFWHAMGLSGGGGTLTVRLDAEEAADQAERDRAWAAEQAEAVRLLEESIAAAHEDIAQAEANGDTEWAAAEWRKIVRLQKSIERVGQRYRPTFR